MTQILVYRSKDGIVLATDSRAVVFDSGEPDDPRLLEVQKLFPLAPAVIAATGGAGFGILLCRKFQRHTRQAGLLDFDEIAEVAPDFFRAEAESYRQKTPSTLLRSDLDRVYVAVAGYVPHGGEYLFRYILLVSEDRTDPMHVVQTSNVLAIPRRLGIEYQLARLPPSEHVLDEVESLFEALLSKLADSGDDVGPPFHFARITSSGIRVRTI